MKKILCFIFILMLPVLVSACKEEASDTQEVSANTPGVNAESSWQDEEIESSLLLPGREEWKGDFDGMQTRRRIRILVPNSHTFYFLDGPKEDGLSYQTAKAFEQWLDEKYKGKHLKTHMIMIPVSRDKLLSSLNQGVGDIAMGGITITPERQQSYDFSAPMASGIKEVFVSARGKGEYKTLDDLAGVKVSVREDSSYAQHIRDLNKTHFEKMNLEPIKIVSVDGNLNDEDILEMVNAGLIDATVVDDFIATMWSPSFPDITVYPDITVNEGGDIAWAFRKDSPLLAAEINEFTKTHKQGTLFGNSLIKKYIKSGKPLYNARAESEIKKFNDVIGIFREYGKEYDFDYLMLVAQGYQESKLDQAARSHRGAVGIMQLLPSTAADPAVGIKDIDTNAHENIHAGVKYMRHLTDVYVKDEALDEHNRILMTFAAYNAGPGNLRKFRKHAQQSGLDPNIWFNNVEISASRIVGQETVQYVSNIYKYYVAYSLMHADQTAETK